MGCQTVHGMIAEQASRADVLDRRLKLKSSGGLGPSE